MTHIKMDAATGRVLSLFNDKNQLTLLETAVLTSTSLEILEQSFIMLRRQGYIESSMTQDLSTIFQNQPFTITEKGLIYLNSTKEERKAPGHRRHFLRCHPYVTLGVSLLIVIIIICIAVIFYLSEH